MAFNQGSCDLMYLAGRSQYACMLYNQGTVLIKSASELKSFSKGEEDQIEQVCVWCALCLCDTVIV